MRKNMENSKQPSPNLFQNKGLRPTPSPIGRGACGTIRRKIKSWGEGLLCLILVLFLSAAAFAAGGSMADPMRVGVGARSMGMGKAYVGVAEDGDTLFINPAGIARNPNIKITSMYCNLLSDTSYTVLGAIYPINEKGAVGIGFVGSQTGDIILRDSAGVQTGTADWKNNVIVVSYANYLNRVFPALGRDILVGTNVKYYSAGASGNYTSSDSGFDMDLGVLFPVTSYMNIGLNAQNFLPTTMSGSKDEIPYNYKVGTSITIIGQKGQAILPHANRKLNLVVDADIEKGGTTPHYGVELWPTSNLALRAGMDDKDFTAGAGVKFYGIEFDYAYHPYSSVPENATHYFSLCYLGEARPRALNIRFTNNPDKSVVYNDYVQLAGKVEVTKGDDETENNSPVSLRINNVDINLNPDLTFITDVPVSKFGKNLIVAAAQSGAIKETQEVRIVRLTSFADVPEGYWAKMPIENNATLGLINGYPDKTFRPDRALTRAELATLLVRAKGLTLPPTNPKQVFKDVKPSFWAAKYIDLAQKEGMIKGYPDRTFRPNNKISKIEGIAVMARFEQLKLASYIEAKPYWDVSTKHWAARHVQAAKDAGMINFSKDNKIRPKSSMVRSEAVDMLALTTFAGGKIKDLYTWEKGFGPQIRTTPAKPSAAVEPTEVVAKTQ